MKTPPPHEVAMTRVAWHTSTAVETSDHALVMKLSMLSDVTAVYRNLDQKVQSGMSLVPLH